MSLVAELMDLPGVIAAGDYAYRGDQYTWRGDITEREARMISTLCRANLETVRMEGDMLAMFSRVCQPGGRGCGFERAKGWMVNGGERSVCVLSNVYCIFDNAEASMTSILRLMRERLKDAPDILI